MSHAVLVTVANKLSVGSESQADWIKHEKGESRTRFLNAMSGLLQYFEARLKSWDCAWYVRDSSGLRTFGGGISDASLISREACRHRYNNIDNCYDKLNQETTSIIACTGGHRAQRNPMSTNSVTNIAMTKIAVRKHLR